MQLERMAVRLRPRNPSEALDLGFALVREHAGLVYGTWLSAYLPIAAVLYVLLWENPIIAWCVLWWLKPFFDRILLALLSQALFGEPVTTRSTLFALRQWLLGTRMFSALTWGRFDLARSFHLPTHQLERLRGSAGRQRVRLLDRDARGAAVWLTFLLFWMEMFLIVAAAVALALIAPVKVPMENILELIFATGGPLREGALAGAVLGTLATSLVEPVYVASGFTLYLQRRTMLEGWDIELRFRHLSDRLAAPGAAVASLVAVLAIACSLLVAPSDALAQAAAVPAKNPAQEIKAILSGPDFGKMENKRELEYIGPKWTSEDKEKPKSRDWTWLEVLGTFIAEAMRFAAWIGGGLLLAVVLYYLAKYARLRGFLGGAQAERPDFLFGLDVRPESLPDDVATAAAALAREGRTREALSLLYRGALVRFLDQGMEFLRGDTEGDCIRKVDRSARDTTRNYFRKLVAAWQTLAYGHRTVRAEAVVALAGEWRQEFAQGASAGEAR